MSFAPFELLTPWRRMLTGSGARPLCQPLIVRAKGFRFFFFFFLPPSRVCHFLLSLRMKGTDKKQTDGSSGCNMSLRNHNGVVSPLACSTLAFQMCQEENIRHNPVHAPCFCHRSGVKPQTVEHVSSYLDATLCLSSEIFIVQLWNTAVA